MRNSGKKFVLFSLVILCMTFAGCCGCDRAEPQSKLFEDDFSNDLANWWSEGTDKVYIADGKLHIDANGEEKVKNYVSTVWCKEKIRLQI